MRGHVHPRATSKEVDRPLRLRASSDARQYAELLQKLIFVPAQMRFVDLAGGEPKDANGVRHADVFPAGANIPKRTTMCTGERPSEGHFVSVRDQIVDVQAEIRKRRCVGLQQRRSSIQSLEQTIGRIE